MRRVVAQCLVVVGLVACSACGDDDSGHHHGSDANGGGGGGDVDAAACVGSSMTLGQVTSGVCAFDVGVSFEPGTINVAIMTGSSRESICHTLRETGCAGNGWYWTREHQIALCTGTCDAASAIGGEVVLEMGCATESCGGGGCTQSTGVCTHSTASQCCSGRCDGDSCGSGLGGPCPVTSPFGCFEGTCQDGYCQCAPGDLQCGASCFDPMYSSANCGACGNACTGGKSCDEGACACPTGQTDCSGTCTTLATDEQNCGMCGRACRADQTCSGSQFSASCVCPAGMRDCNGACVSETSPLHCGACNNVCDAGTETCTPLVSGGAYCACNAGLFDCGSNGTCEDRMTDENNCGTCGRICPGNKMCIAGDC